MGEKEKQRENPCPLSLYCRKVKSLYSVWSRGFYSQPIIQITKITKQNTITMGAKREENHKSQEAKTGSRKEQGMINSAQYGEQW